MNTCPIEIVNNIIELACADDFGQTARLAGLVSKYFRVLAEPIEFRAIAVSGLKQLEAASNRLDNLEGSGGKSIEVQHLFISELTMEHALAVETNFSNIDSQNPSGSFWLTREGGEARQFYLDHDERFWALASTFVKKTSPKLRTLFIIGCDSHVHGENLCPRVLGILSDAAFPSLVSLAVLHNVALDSWGLSNKAMRFLPPKTPSLRKLHIMSPIPTSRLSQGRRAHPLLEGPLLSPNSELTDLVISGLALQRNALTDVENVMRAVFGEKWSAEPRSQAMPGKPRSVILQLGGLYHDESGVMHKFYASQAQNFITVIEELHIDGLEVHFPMPRFPEEGKRRYELLLAEWKEECLEWF